MAAMSSPALASAPGPASEPTISTPKSTASAADVITALPTDITSGRTAAAGPDRRHDLTDVPKELLVHIFSELPPGHRLDLRAVSRAWATWVGNSLAASTHLNLVLDVHELRRALRRLQLVRQQLDGSGGGAAPASSGGAGILEAKFPLVANVRLWAGCRPLAALAGSNGGSATCGTAREQILQSASAAITSAALRLQSQLIDLVHDWMAGLLQRLSPRQPPWLLPPCLPPLQRRRQPPTATQPKWHVHKAAAATAADKVALLRRYALDYPDVRLPPLATCLPVVGPSHALKRLSVVTAHDLTLEELIRVREFFPHLKAVALHAHKDVSLDFKPAELRSLEPLSAPATAAAPPLETLVLSGLLCDWAEGQGGLTALTQLRSLVLHRLRCRAHRLLPQVKALTQLTRLELRGLDYHHSLPMDPTDLALLDRKIRLRNLDRDGLERDRHRSRAAATSCSGNGVGGDDAGAFAAETASSSSRNDGDAAAVEEAADRSEGSEEEDAWEAVLRHTQDIRQPCKGLVLRDAPWMWVPHHGAGSLIRGARPDWHATMRSLGRMVGVLTDLRVFVCDIECPADTATPRGLPAAAPAAAAAEEWPPSLAPVAPPGTGRRGQRRDPWALLLAGVCRLRNLRELRLPYLVLRGADQMAELAAAMPGLTTLELAGLPPPPPPPRSQRASSPDRASRCAAVWRRYIPTELDGAVDAAACSGGEGGGSGARPPWFVRKPCRRVHSLEDDVDEVSGGGRDDSDEEHSDDEHGVGDSGDDDGGDDDGSDVDLSIHSPSSATPGRPRLSSFRQLRELVLHRSTVRQLSYWLPLPPQLRRLQVHVQHMDHGCGGWGCRFEGLDLDDLLLLHRRLLPTLRKVPDLSLTLGGAAHIVNRPQPRRRQPGAATVPATVPITTTTAATTNNNDSNGRNGTPTLAAVARRASASASEPPSAFTAVSRGEVLVMAMLVSWVPRSLTCLDLFAVMRPEEPLQEQEALACLRLVAEGVPALRRLSCCLWLGSKGPMDPESPADKAAAEIPATAAAIAAGVMQGCRVAASRHGRSSSAGDGCGDTATNSKYDKSAAPASRAWCGPSTAVECLNDMQCLEELRIKALARRRCTPCTSVGYGSTTLYCSARVPLGFVRALRRSLRVVDCSPLETWYSSDGAVHPRDALQQARAALAAAGCPALLVSEAEEWAARFTGLAPDMEATWRGSVAGL